MLIFSTLSLYDRVSMIDLFNRRRMDMTHEEYFPQCCYEANEALQISMMLNKEVLLKAANGNMENDARMYLFKRP